jgi:hypothetical protein
MKIYDKILMGHNANIENAIDTATFTNWAEHESTRIKSKYKHSNYIQTLNGVEIYYDYGADYYYFVEVCPTCKGTRMMSIKVRDHEGCADIKWVECEHCN